MKLRIAENGPIIVDTADAVSVTGPAGTESKPGPVYLCRCGQSANKPFCDGTHRKVKFEGKGGELSCP
jgi:CDGSH iron-sulfur domain-containing protein 3